MITIQPRIYTNEPEKKISYKNLLDEVFLTLLVFVFISVHSWLNK